MAIDLSGIVGWLKGWFYDKTEVTGFLNTKANQSDLQTLQGVVTNLSGSVNNKIDTAGTGLSKTGTTLNHSNSITAQTSIALKKIKYDSEGHITGTDDVNASDIQDPNANNYSYIGSMSSGASQQQINSLINSSIGDIKNTEFIVVTNNKGSASASKVNKLYVVSENNEINYYYVKQTGTNTYEWQNFDANIVVDTTWDNVKNKPTSYPPTIHRHLLSEINGLEGVNVHHVSQLPSSYGDTDSDALYIVDTNNGYDLYIFDDSQTSGALGDYGTWVKKGHIFSPNENVITSIELVPKSTDATGTIKFYTGDEPT